MSKEKVGVFWDINTCPIPDHIERRSVRLRIESEMKKHIKTPFRVVVTCFGNLDYILPEILHDLARSGINLAHAPCGIFDLRRFVLNWSKETELSDTVMLISGRYWWVWPSGLGWKRTVLHVRGVGAPGKLVWDAVLDNNPVDETNNPLDVVASCDCYLCNHVSRNSDDFIKHLQSNEHKKETFDLSWRTDDNGNLVHFCKVCNYAGYDQYNMDIHYDSNYHKEKMELAKKEAQEENCKSCGDFMSEELKEKDNMDIHYDSDYHKDKMELAEKEALEENCKSGGDFMSEEHKEDLEASRKRTGNQLLNEANKKR